MYMCMYMCMCVVILQSNPIPITGEGVTNEKGLVVVKRSNVPHITSSSTLDVLNATPQQQAVRPLQRIELDEKGVPHLLALDEVAAPIALTTSSSNQPLLPGAGTELYPPPLSPASAAAEHEPALDDEFGGRDPSLTPSTAASHKSKITHTQALVHLYKAYKSSEEYKALGLELWAMEPNFVDPKHKKKEPKFNGSFALQVWLCLIRQLQIVWRNKVC